MSRPSASRSPRRLFTPSDWLSIARTIWQWRLAILIAVVDLVVVGAEIGYWRLPQALRSGRWFELREFGGFSFGIAHPVLVALATSQTALLAIWAFFGRGTWPLRWLAAASGTCLWIAALGAVSTGAYKPSLIEVLLLAQWVIMAALALPTRLLRNRCAVASISTAEEAQTRRAQFKLIDLFWGTAAVAFLLALSPSLRLVKTFDELRRVVLGPGTSYDVREGRGILFALIVYGTVCAISAVLMLWAASQNRRSWRRLLIAGALTWAIGRIGMGVVMVFKVNDLADVSAYLTEPHAYLLWFCLHAGMVVGLLAAIRPRDGWLLRAASQPNCERQSTDDPSKRSFRRAAIACLMLSLLSLAWFFDDLSALVFGNGAYRRAIGAVSARDGRQAVVLFGDSIGVWPRRPLAAGDFEYYRRLPAIAGFYFDDGPTDESTWDQLRRWPRLRFLGLGRGITDEHLKRVAELPDLEIIWLHSPDVTDAGLLHLHRLSKLQSLQTEHSSGITAAGVQQLRAALPRALIPFRP